MPPGQPPDPSMHAGKKESLNWLYFLANTYAVCVLPFLRKNMGIRAIGTPGFFAWLAMLLYAGHTGSPEMLLYIKAWFACVLYHRFIRPDRRQDTGFQGWPILTDWLIKRDTPARALEAVLVYLIGWQLCAWSESVGQFVAYASYALTVKLFVQSAVQRQENEDTHNAIVRMQIMQERMEAARRQQR